MVERESGGGGEKVNEEEDQKKNTALGGDEEEQIEQVARDVEKGEMRYQEEAVGNMRNVNNQAQTMTQTDYHASMLQRLNPTNPLRIAINGRTRVATPSPAPSQPSVSRSTPTPQVCSAPSLSRNIPTFTFREFLLALLVREFCCVSNSVIVIHGSVREEKKLHFGGCI